MEVVINTDQIKILQDFLNDLSKADQRKIFISGFRKAARPMVSTMKALAPYRKKGISGNLRRNIGTVEVPGEVAILVGAKSKAFYGRFLEPDEEHPPKERFWKHRKAKDGGKRSTGIMTIHKFVEPAWDVTHEQVHETINNEWYNEIDKYMKRVNNKLKK